MELATKDNIVSNKVIDKTHDLYKVNPIIFKDMLYKDVLEMKIDICKNLISDILSQHYLKRDTERMIRLSHAQDFNQQLLDELGDLDD